MFTLIPRMGIFVLYRGFLPGRFCRPSRRAAFTGRRADLFWFPLFIHSYGILSSASCGKERAGRLGTGIPSDIMSYPSSLRLNLFRLNGPGILGRAVLARGSRGSDTPTHRTLPDQGPKWLAPDFCSIHVSAEQAHLSPSSLKPEGD